MEINKKYEEEKVGKQIQIRKEEKLNSAIIFFLKNTLNLYAILPSMHIILKKEK